MNTDTVLREHLLELLHGGDAHMSYEEAIAEYPLDRINEKFPHGQYSSWALLEHVRLSQDDLIQFIGDEDYQEGRWPEDYWPEFDKQATEEDWWETIRGFRDGNRALIALVENDETDLFARIPWGNGKTIVREIMVVADHNAYHIGELAIMREVMGTWSAGHS
ncbi:MAG: DinB family protein [Nitrolancea sp.]